MDTPDTSTYMIAGFVISFVTMGAYLLSLYLRNRNLRRDEETLEGLQNENPRSKNSPK